MALRKPTFEGSEDNAGAAVEGVVVDKTVETAPAVEQPAVIAAAEEAAAVVAEAKTAVAPVQKTALALGGAKYQPALQEFKDQIDPSTLDFDTFPRVTVGLDGFSDDKDKDLGNVVKLKLMSWNERFIITPGVDNDEANALVAYSLDGKTIEATGQSTADYLKYLMETEGYKEASIKKYYAIYGFLVESNGAAVDPEDQSIVSIQVPPRSVSLFTRYQIERGVKISQGIVQPSDLLVLTMVKAKGKTKNYASIAFSAK
jgi:Fe-S-cluster formation regulator IscX/YfhJ